MFTIYGFHSEIGNFEPFCYILYKLWREHKYINWNSNKLSGFPNHCNGAEGIHDFGDLCKYGHVRQASPGTHPTLETNKRNSNIGCVVNTP